MITEKKIQIVNAIKNISILTDFVISLIASSIKAGNENLSNTLFGISAVILSVAVVCVIIEWIHKKK